MFQLPMILDCRIMKCFDNKEILILENFGTNYKSVYKNEITKLSACSKEMAGEAINE